MPQPTETVECGPTKSTEARLFDEALTLFATKGFAATSVREIIEATGVTRPVLYYYCDSKQDLFVRVVRWKHDEAYALLKSRIADEKGIAQRLRTIVRGTFEFCAADSRVPQLMFQTTYGPVVSELADFMQELATHRFGIVVNVMQQGLESGELHGGDANSLALLFCSVMDYHANVLSRLESPEAKLTPELADGLVDSFLFGVATARRKTPHLPPTL